MIGPRVYGGPEEYAAADYIAGKLQSFGYEVDRQRFTHRDWVSRAVSLAVETPESRTLRVQALTYSESGTASGDLVFAGLGRDGEFPESVRGRIALVDRGVIPFLEKARNAEAAGATALIIANSEVDVLSGTLGQSGPTIPVLGIARADGQQLKGWLESGPVRVRLSFAGGVADREAFNVVARPPGTACRVVAGGHYDTVESAPGGSDNASGTAAVIELARVTALRGNPEQACFVAFTAEEIGLVGSRYFVENLSAADRDALQYMLNFDMVGVGTAWWLIGTPELQRQGEAIAADLGIAARPSVLSGASSDHASFIQAGIPALMLHRVSDTLLHTPEDVAERVSPEQLAEAVRLGLAFLDGIEPS